MTIKEKDSNHMSKIKLMSAVDRLILNDKQLSLTKRSSTITSKQELLTVNSKFERYVAQCL